MNVARCAWMVAIAAVVGCSGGPVDGPSVADTRQPIATTATTSLVDGTQLGSYTVPTTDPALAPFATFSVTVKVQQLADGTTRLHYTLPSVLVGTPTDVDLAGTLPTLTGASGTATCAATASGTSVACTEHLTGLALDMTQIAAAIALSGTTLEQAALQTKVAQGFLLDPIGILELDAAPRGGGHGVHGGSAGDGTTVAPADDAGAPAPTP